MIKEIRALFLNELTIEWRQKNATFSILLYVVSTVFVCYLSIKRVIDIPTWNALFWIIILFTSINAVSKSFSGYTKGKWLYLYSIASPQAVIISKILYNSLLLSLFACISLFFYSTFLGNPINNLLLFLITILLGCVGISSILVLMSAIASKAESNMTLLAVLSFPLILPLLMVIQTLSKSAIDGLAFSVYINYLLITGAIDVIVVALSFMLFPYLWQD